MRTNCKRSNASIREFGRRFSESESKFSGLLEMEDFITEEAFELAVDRVLTALVKEFNKEEENIKSRDRSRLMTNYWYAMHRVSSPRYWCTFDDCDDPVAILIAANPEFRDMKFPEFEKLCQTYGFKLNASSTLLNVEEAPYDEDDGIYEDENGMLWSTR